MKKQGKRALTDAEKQRRSRAMKRGVSLKPGEIPPARKPGRKPRGKTALKDAELREYKRDWMRANRATKAPAIAVLDMESDPFDGCSEILPFVAELWDGANSVVIWEDDYEQFVVKLLAALLALDPSKKWIVYAHNGGRFDWMYLVHKLRGQVSFKGGSLMSARIASHVELRDSMHIIPSKLAAYQKEAFDYNLLYRNVRHQNRAKILAYLHSDCVYLYDIVKHFIDRHGPKLSIGQAAWHILRKQYGIENLGEASDEYLRQFYFGGRVECPQGPGVFEGDYELSDVNSMYPDRMAHCLHPIGCEFSVRGGNGRITPRINNRTAFLVVECTNFGALIGRDSDGRLSANIPNGEFWTTIHEFNTAERLGLIRDIRIKTCVDFFKFSDFSEYILPRYAERQSIKDQLDNCDDNSNLLPELKRDSLIIKLEMNNGYGKGAQNPRNFVEYFYTDCNEYPSNTERCGINQYRDLSDNGIWSLDLESEGEFLIWKKPCQNLRFNNVAMSASITGAARAKLLEKMVSVDDLIYCDTDSVICRKTNSPNCNDLGAWKTEKLINNAVIAGKKLYAYLGDGYSPVVRSKGGSGLSFADMEQLVNGQEITRRQLAPHFEKTGFQSYTERTFKLTAERGYMSRIFLA